MKDWMLPTLGAMLCWGVWGFIPKLTTRYLSPQSAIVYEVVGAVCLAAIALVGLKFQPDFHPLGIFFAIITGMLGFLGAFCFLNAVSTGPVTLVATLSALYPAISVLLAVAFLHEPITLRQGFGIALALASVILVAA
jgi:bacterial/archaeal transporter family protein